MISDNFLLKLPWTKIVLQKHGQFVWVHHVSTPSSETDDSEEPGGLNGVTIALIVAFIVVLTPDV